MVYNILWMFSPRHKSDFKGSTGIKMLRNSGSMNWINFCRNYNGGKICKLWRILPHLRNFLSCFLGLRQFSELSLKEAWNFLFFNRRSLKSSIDGTNIFFICMTSGTRVYEYALPSIVVINRKISMSQDC